MASQSGSLPYGQTPVPGAILMQVAETTQSFGRWRFANEAHTRCAPTIGAPDYSALSPLELAHCCARTTDPPAWEEFVRRFHPLIARTVARTARRWGAISPQLVEDLVQETYLKLCTKRCRSLSKFQASRGDAIFGFIRTVASNLVNDYFRSLHTMKRGSRQSVSECDASEPAESGASEALDLKILLQQIDRTLERADARDRLIFWHYYREGRSAPAIAALPSICLSTKGVESVLLRLTRLVRERLVPPVAPACRERMASSAAC